MGGFGRRKICLATGFASCNPSWLCCPPQSIFLPHTLQWKDLFILLLLASAPSTVYRPPRACGSLGIALRAVRPPVLFSTGFDLIQQGSPWPGPLHSIVPIVFA